MTEQMQAIIRKHAASVAAAKQADREKLKTALKEISPRGGDTVFDMTVKEWLAAHDRFNDFACYQTGLSLAEVDKIYWDFMNGKEN